MESRIGLPTPRSLDEAIVHALMVGPLSEVRERAYLVLKDFLAQRFGVAMLKASGDEHMEETLRSLFDSIVEKDNPKLRAFETLTGDPYYARRMAGIPVKYHEFMRKILRETAAMNADEYAVFVRNLFLDDASKPKCWGAIDEILAICGSKANTGGPK